LRWLLGGLFALLLVLQYRLWIAEGSLAEKHRLQQQVGEQTAINTDLRERNAALEREVLELQGGNAAVEQRAREQLGLIREGELYYQFPDDPAPARPRSTAASRPTVGGASPPAASAAPPPTHTAGSPPAGPVEPDA
jgi:cell division protein FtsB